jgi:hypothetical protein
LEAEVTIIHDAYMVDTKAQMRSLIEGLKIAADSGYALLREKALSIYDKSTSVQRLLLDYGGWDKQSVQEQIPVQQTDDDDDVIFWLMILVMEHLEHENDRIKGLRTEWKKIHAYLRDNGWHENDSDLVVFGRPASSVALNHLDDSSRDEKLHKYLERMKPQSVGGQIGWLLTNDINTLYLKLQSLSDEQNKSYVDQHALLILSDYKNSLRQALEYRMDLCLILSG